MYIFINLLILIFCLFLLAKGAGLATKYSVSLAESFNLSKFVIGFLVVSVISILPETFISINSAMKGVPELGLGTLFGSNVADLTLVFAIVIWASRRNLKVKSTILKNNKFYPLLILFPVMLGLDGYFSRIEGIILITFGIIFYFFLLKNEDNKPEGKIDKKHVLKNFILLLFSMALLLVSSNFAVSIATNLADILNINTVLIGIFIIGLSTTMPELFFALKSVKNNHDSLAVGDILGTVLADATIVVGIIAIISPFSFPYKIAYTTGLFMVISALLLFYFMYTGKNISKKEAVILFVFWMSYVFVEIFVNSKM